MASEQFQNIIAPNKALNATLEDGHRLQSQIMSEGLDANPRLYANQTGGHQAGMVPEKESQDNSDLPAWAHADGLGDLAEVPKDLPIYLQVWVGQRENFYNVAGVNKELKSGKALSQALR